MAYAHVYFWIWELIFFSIWLLSVLRGHSVVSSPPQRPMTSNFEGFSIQDFIHYIYLNSWAKRPVFPFLMFSAKQGNYLVQYLWRLWYDALLDWGLNPRPPALDASTLPQGYRGGGWELIVLGVWNHLGLVLLAKKEGVYYNKHFTSYTNLHTNIL